MKILVFIVVISIALVVFYLFLRKAFDGRLDKTKDTEGEIKPLLPEEEQQEETLEEDSQVEKGEPEEQKQPEDTDCCQPSAEQEQCCEEKEVEQIEPQE